jgi:NAD(P)-dependent dehydrogenase (short-subunit alcohol dehydrogenase family)
MERRFINRVVLITGAGSGIGRATALAFAREGAQVVIADRNELGVQETAAQILKNQGSALAMTCDVTAPESVQKLFQKIESEFGALDHAFNNAGIEGPSTEITEATIASWNEVLSVNLSGVFFCMKEELRLMRLKSQGTIVNCASIAGLRGFSGMAAYTASKHGVLGLTKAAALEAARYGVRITALCPGVVKTPMIERYTKDHPDAEASLLAETPMNRMASPDEIAHAVLWLSGPESTFVTGSTLVIDGGWCAK